jgi:uncharacterized short protein YbdD (DUF466 family)
VTSRQRAAARDVVRPLWPAAALRRAWLLVREWSGDAAYETYLARNASVPPLTREEFYLDSLRRRYGQPGRCC